MARTILLYALALAATVGALDWIEYRHATRVFSTEATWRCWRQRSSRLVSGPALG